VNNHDRGNNHGLPYPDFFSFLLSMIRTFFNLLLPSHHHFFPNLIHLTDVYHHTAPLSPLSLGLSHFFAPRPFVLFFSLVFLMPRFVRSSTLYLHASLLLFCFLLLFLCLIHFCLKFHPFPLLFLFCLLYIFFKTTVDISAVKDKWAFGQLVVIGFTHSALGWFFAVFRMLTRMLTIKTMNRRTVLH